MRISDWSSDVCSSDLTTGLICGPTSSPRSCRPLCSCLALSINCVRRCLSLSRRCKALRVEAMIDGGSEAVNMYGRHATRSEEHTSELQSLMRISYAVFCLNKKNNYNNTKYHTTCLISTQH